MSVHSLYAWIKVYNKPQEQRVYGYRKIHDDLRELGEICGRNRVGRLMQAEGCVRKRVIGGAQGFMAESQPSPRLITLRGSSRSVSRTRSG